VAGSRRPPPLTAEQRELAARLLPLPAELPQVRAPAPDPFADQDAPPFSAGDWELLEERAVGAAVRRAYANREAGRWCWVQGEALDPDRAGDWLAAVLDTVAVRPASVRVLETRPVSQVRLAHPAVGRWEHTQGRDGDGVAWYLGWRRPGFGLVCCCVAPRVSAWTWPEVVELAGAVDGRLSSS
jgi:hypothetical protein